MATVKTALNSFGGFFNVEKVEEVKNLPLTIKSLVEEEVGKDKELKYVLSFVEHKLKLVMSKGRAVQLGGIVGDDVDPAGAKIKIEKGISYGREAIVILPAD